MVHRIPEPNPALSRQKPNVASLVERCADVVVQDAVAFRGRACPGAAGLAALPEPLLECLTKPVLARAAWSGSAREALRWGLCAPSMQPALWSAIDPYFGLLRTPMFDLLEQPEATIFLLGRLIEETRVSTLRQLTKVEMQERLEDLRRTILQGGLAPSTSVNAEALAAVLSDLLKQMHVAQRLRYTPMGARLLPEAHELAFLHEQSHLVMERQFNADAWRRFCDARNRDI